MIIHYKQVSSLLASLVLTLPCFAQPAPDTLHQKAIAFAAAKFAEARPFNIEYSGVLPYTFSPKVNDLAWPGGKFTRFSQLKVSSNLNLIKRQRWVLGLNFQYKYISAGVDLAHPNAGGFSASGRNFQYHNTALNFTYFSRLFNKPVIYGASVMVDGSEKHFERVKGMAFGTLVLKADARTKMTAGIVVNVDATSLIPVLPTFSYEHKFHDDWSVDVILPKYLYLRKFVSNNDRISVGTEFDRTSFYLYDLNPGNLSQRYEYQQLDLNTGVTYEHLLGNYFILMVRGGLRFTPNGKVFEKSDYGSPVYQTSPAPAPFFNVGLSFNPFIRRRKN